MSTSLPSDTTMERIRLNLLENGIDFIRSAVEDYFLSDDTHPVAFKYAVLHMYAGVLLLLKEKIRREDPALVFKKGGRTLNFTEIQAALPTVGVELSLDDVRTLERFQELRNVLEHYVCELDLPTTKELLGTLAAFAYFFMRDELGEDLGVRLEASTGFRLMELKTIHEQHEAERRADWGERAEKYFDLSDKDVAAFVNGIEPYHPRHNPFPVELIECPECGEETVLLLEPDLALCTSLGCKEVFSADRCLRCDAPVFYGSVFCSMCADYIDRD